MFINKLDAASIAGVRSKLINLHYQKKIGHLGGNLSCIDSMLLIFHEFIGDDDKFILSKGHAAGALYVTLWSLGRLTEEELSTFHSDDTFLPGHPPINKFREISFSTGSLGHGLSLAAGSALASKLRSDTRKVICMTSDGEWQEGATWEALIFATHHNLSNLTIVVDQNGLQGFGSTDQVASMGNLKKKLSGFEVDLLVVDGHNIEDIRSSLAYKSHKIKLILLQTIKGKGINSFEGRFESHYLPLEEWQYQELTKIGAGNAQ